MNFKLKFIKFLDWLPEFICLMTLYFSFLKYAGHMGKLADYLSLVFSLFLWFYLAFSGLFKKKEWILVIIFALVTLFFFIGGKGKIRMFFCFLPVALFLLKKETLKSVLWIAIPLAIVLDLLIAWLNSPDKVVLYTNITRNYVSVFLLYALAIYIIYLERNSKRINLIYIIFAWLFSVSAIGRGGILTFSAVLGLFVIQRFFLNEKKEGVWKYIKILILFIAVYVLLIFVAINLEHIIQTYFYRFFNGEGLTSTARVNFIENYFKQCSDSLVALFFGGNPEEASNIVNNLHNSYLQFHSEFGLIGFVFLIVGCIYSVFYLYKNRKWQYLIVFIGILIRSLTDWCFPGFPLDFALLFFIFYPFFDVTDENRKIRIESLKEEVTL